MKEKRLSIIVPIYNTEQYLNRCIDSIISAINNVTFEVEIILINDASKGNCDDIVLEYIEKYKNLIKYIKQENSGLAQTKNIGIENSTGEYISFIDSDDFIDENFYKDAFNIINERKADVVICDWETISKDNRFIVPAKDTRYSSDKLGCIDVQIMPSSCNKIAKKELFENLYFPNKLRYEDLATTLIMLLKAKKIVYLNKPYYKYYLSEGSIMRSDFDEKKFQMIDVFKILFERLDNMNLNKEEKEVYEYMVYTRRLYEELIEPIAIGKNGKIKFELCKKFCDKISDLNSYMCKNKYFIENVYGKSKFLKKVSNKMLHFCLNKKHYRILYLILKKRIYYSLFAIRYGGKDVIDFFNKENDV